MNLKVVLFRESGRWVAQVLEHDITSQGRSTDDAIYELSRLIVGDLMLREINPHLAPLDSLPSAPDFYWEMYEGASSFDKHLADLGVTELPEIECRLAA